MTSGLPGQPMVDPARRKRVLVVSYSQTGQLARIVERVVEPLRASDSGIEVHWEVLQPLRPFPFPWPILRFFDAFPESAHLDPAPIAPLSIPEKERFDLVIVAYQVWFLAPAQPIVAFLKSPDATRLLAGKPVVTIIGCRNMWLMAQEKMKRLLSAVGARLVDNVVLTDRSPTLASLVTTPRWLLTGRRDAVFGLPAAGISASDIDRSRRFGRALRDALNAERELGKAPMLDGLCAVEADPKLLISERAGTRSFFIWGKLIRLFGGPGAWARQPIVVLYIVFLILLILTVVPLSLLLQALLRPLMASYLNERKAYHEAPSGSGNARLADYDY